LTIEGTIDFHRRYHEESHLFEVVGPRFQKHGVLSVYDLFFIVRWKANRAVSTVAKSLMKIGGHDLERVAGQLSADLRSADSPKARFMVLSSVWKLR